jgi:hypothetical protein
MRMKFVLAQIMLWAFIAAAGQKEATFSVSKGEVKLLPNLDTLLAGCKYNFTVTGIASNQISAIKFSGGIVTILDSGIDVRTDSTLPSSRKCLLEIVYQKRKTLLAFKKTYVIISLADLPKFVPPPGRPNTVVYIFAPWKNFPLSTNDTVSVKTLVTRLDSGLQAARAAMDVNYNISSFDIILNCVGQNNKLHGTSQYFTAEMQQKLLALAPGCTIVFDKVTYSATNGSIENCVAGPFKIYVKN